jgi:hypothetical protein
VVCSSSGRRVAVALVQIAAVTIATPGVSSSEPCVLPGFSNEVEAEECKPPPPPPPGKLSPPYAPQSVPPPRPAPQSAPSVNPVMGSRFSGVDPPFVAAMPRSEDKRHHV